MKNAKTIKARPTVDQNSGDRWPVRDVKLLLWPSSDIVRQEVCFAILPWMRLSVKSEIGGWVSTYLRSRVRLPCRHFFFSINDGLGRKRVGEGLPLSVLATTSKYRVISYDTPCQVRAKNSSQFFPTPNPSTRFDAFCWVCAACSLLQMARRFPRRFVGVTINI